MKEAYIFRGERAPFAPDPKETRERESAKREAEQLVNQTSPVTDRDLSKDAKLQEIIGDYQVGGLDSFGAES